MLVRNLAVLAVGLAGFAIPIASRAETVNRWVQMAPDNMVLLRAITDGPNDACPMAAVDGSPVTLGHRNDPAAAGGAFPITQCEATVPRGGRPRRSTASR